MSLHKAIEVIAKLAETGVIQHYAIAGAVAALNYVQPTFSEDLDIPVLIGNFNTRQSELILLTPIETALAAMGYTERTGVSIMIEGWPVQFLPAASELDEEALRQAVDVDVNLPDDPPLKARCLRAEHVVAFAVKLGRLKDLARVEGILEQHAVDVVALKDVLERHGLIGPWRSFCMKAGIENPLQRT